MSIHPVMDVSVTPAGVVSRRGFLRRSATAVSAAGVAGLGWRDMVMAATESLRARGKSIILLWMDGGPSQFETFNPKVFSENQGPCGEIATNVPGVNFAEFWPQTAQIMDRLSVIRSMKSTESEHDRAIALVRTGYPPNVSIRYPTWGSVVAWHQREREFDLPSFVRIGKPRIATRDVDFGVLGVNYAPLKLDDPSRLPPNVRPGVPAEVLRRRLALADQFDREFAGSGAERAVEEKRTVYERTSRFVLSPRIQAFDLEREPVKLRDAYGRTRFGQGCLLARRLIEEGVTFVEVISTGDRNDAGWDTHKEGFRDTPNLCQEVDPAYPTLIRDLEDRGLLEDTLVVWMGEFGRTPKLKEDGGRDHYATGWITALAGAGVVGGQVIGATDIHGVEVTDRPVEVADLFVTFCHVMGMDPHQEYWTPDQRPIKLVEGGSLIGELFGSA